MACLAVLLAALPPTVGLSTPPAASSAVLASTAVGPGEWHRVTASVLSPPPRQSGAMAFDPLLHAYVLFGGYHNGPLGDTWTFANGQWANATPRLATAPSPRWYDSMVWDPADGYVLLFGGRNALSDFGDTWAFNGTGWHLERTAVSPPPMTSGRMAYDARDGYVLMYGGYSIMPGAPSFYDATWTYLHGRWTNVTASVVGAPRDPHVVTYATYDAGDGYVLLFGGTFAGGPRCKSPGYTWTYSNRVFTNVSGQLARAPPLLEGSRMMVYDPSLPGVVLYGGWDGGSCPFSNETWVFHAGAWERHDLTYNPGPLWDAAMAVDPGAGTALLFGGNTAPYTPDQSPWTWRFLPS